MSRIGNRLSRFAVLLKDSRILFGALQTSLSIWRSVARARTRADRNENRRAHDRAGQDFVEPGEGKQLKDDVRLYA